MSDIDPQDQNQDQDWRSSLPEDIRSHAAVTKYATQESMARAMIHAQELIGKKGILVPGESASETERLAFEESIAQHRDLLARHLIQVPDGPDGYNVDPPGELPSGLTLDEKMVEGFRAKAHEAGLTAEQARALYEWYWDANSSAYTDAVQAGQGRRSEAEASLRREWGNKFDSNLALAQKVVRNFAAPDLIEYLDSSGLGNHPAVIRMMVKVGQVMSEDSMPLDGKSSNETLTHEQLRKMMADPRYRDPSRRDPDFIRRVDQGYRQIFGE